MTQLTDQQRQKIEGIAQQYENRAGAEGVACAEHMGEYIMTHLSEFLPDDLLDKEIFNPDRRFMGHETEYAYREGMQMSPYRAMYEAVRQERDAYAIRFLDDIRDYEMECGHPICNDERSSKEFLEIFKEHDHADKTAE